MGQIIALIVLAATSTSQYRFTSGRVFIPASQKISKLNLKTTLASAL